MSSSPLFTKTNLEQYFFALAEAYRKLAKKNAIPLEIVLIGGASILLNYDFRENTSDVDGIFPTAEVLKMAIKSVATKFELDPKWLNSDFVKTASFSNKLRQHSVHYRDYHKLISVRTINNEFLIAMKLVAGRMYKNDISDIVGIVNESEKRGVLITKENVSNAVLELYGSLDVVNETSWLLFNQIIDRGEYNKQYLYFRRMEIENKEMLLEFEKEYPSVLTPLNFREIMQSLQDARERDKLSDQDLDEDKSD